MRLVPRLIDIWASPVKSCPIAFQLPRLLAGIMAILIIAICPSTSHASGLSQIEAFLRERDIEYVTYHDWKILDQYEVGCAARQGRPRGKGTTQPEMVQLTH